MLTSPEKDRLWRIARANGESLTCRQLTTLQQWILEGKVKREDRISVSGETWKTLGSIPELEKLFQMQDDAALGRTIRESGTVKSDEVMNLPGPTPDIPVVPVIPGVPTAVAVASGAATATIVGGGAWEDVARDIRQQRAQPQASPEPSPAQLPNEVAEAVETPATLQGIPAPTQPMKKTPSGSWKKDDIPVDIETAVLKKPRRSRGVWLIALFFVFGLGLAAGYAYYANRTGQHSAQTGKQTP